MSSEPAASGSGRRPALPRLTALRGLGASLILLAHFILLARLPEQQLDDDLIDVLHPLAVAGVSGFFALSGFALTWVSREWVPRERFWRRRFARIAPVHVVTWTLALTLLAIAGESGALWKMIPSLIFANVWIPDLEIFWGPNIPSWTLSVEVFFYALFPLLLPIIWRIPRRWLWPIIGGLVATTALWALLVGLFVPPTHPVPEGTPMSRLQYFAIVVVPPIRLIDFVLGMLAARLAIEGFTLPRGRLLTYGALIAGYVLARWVIPRPMGFVVAFQPAIFFALVYSANADLAGRASRFHAPAIQWLGAISFALYLVHWPLIDSFHWLIGDPVLSPVAAIADLLLMVVLCVGVASLIHIYVERPWAVKLAPPSGSLSAPAAAVAPARVDASSASPNEPRPAGEAGRGETVGRRSGPPS